MKKINLLIFAFTLFTFNLLVAMVDVNAQNPNKFIKHNKHGIKDHYIVSLI